MKKILVATDFSPPAIHALQQAHDLALQDNARLVLLSVQEPLEVIEGEFGMPPPPPTPSDEEVIVRLQSQLPAHSPVAVEFVIAHGNAATEIVRIARELDCDCIVLGAHEDHGWISSFFHPSVVDLVKQSAPCPVIETPADTTANA